MGTLPVPIDIRNSGGHLVDLWEAEYHNVGSFLASYFMWPDVDSAPHELPPRHSQGVYTARAPLDTPVCAC